MPKVLIADALSPRAASLAPAVDAAIVVATRDRAGLAETRRTAELLRLAGIEVAGAILTRRPAPAPKPEPEPRRRADDAPEPV